MPNKSETENLIGTSRETKENVNTKPNIYPLKFLKRRKKIVYSRPNMKSKHVSEEIEKISQNNCELKN